MKIRHALLMAAGRGMRMRPLTDAIPKAMAPFRGETLIAAGLRMIKREVEHVHVTVGYKSAMLAEHLMQIGVSSVLNTEGHPNCWWMYHSLMRNLDEPVFVLTCDNVIRLDFDVLTRDYADVGSPACMVVPVVPVGGLEGDYIEHDGQRVVGIDRNKASDVYCSGIQVLNPKRVADLAKEGDSFYTVWQQLMDAGQLWMSTVYPETWFAVDTLEQLHRVSEAEGKEDGIQ